MRRLALAGVFLWTAVSHGQLLDAVVARVDQTVITWSEVVQELAIRRLTGAAERPVDPRVGVDALVRRRLLVADARKMRLLAPAAEVQAEVRALMKAAGGAEVFEPAARRLGLTAEDLARRAAEVVLMRRYLDLRRDMTYVPESEVRNFYSSQLDVLGKRPLAEARDEVRSFLAQRKFQQQLDEWITRQVTEGRVRLLEPSGGWPPLPAGP